VQVEDAAARLAEVLREEHADVLTVYDPAGGYGHPDHVAVHTVGVRAAELAGTRRVFEATQNKTQIQALIDQARREHPERFEKEFQDGFEIGMPEELITTAVDVRAFVDVKREAMKAHASQIGDTSFFLELPTERFVAAFGVEWFIHRGLDAPPRPMESDLFEGLA
jgi:LmbE family N-acetylglucosaminyl deacetylase